MKNFEPHQFAVTIDFSEKFPMPKIILSNTAYEKMLLYVDIAGKEVGWLGTASQNGHVFLIEDVFLLKQQVHSSETEISNEGLSDFGTELLSKPGGVETWDKIRFWGHSHVNMGVDPSNTDNTQMKLFEKCGHDFFIRGIFNKDSKAKFSLYLYKDGLTFHDCKWEREAQPVNPMRAAIEQEFKEKVTERSVMGFTQGGAYQYGSYHAGNVVGPTGGGANNTNKRQTKHGNHDVVQLPAHYRGKNYNTQHGAIPERPTDGRLYIFNYQDWRWELQEKEKKEERRTVRVWNHRINDFVEYHIDEDDGGLLKIPELQPIQNEAKKDNKDKKVLTEKELIEAEIEQMIKYHSSEYDLTGLGD